MNTLEVKDLNISFDGKNILNGVNFHIHPGEIVCLLGASGSGKSTALRCIAGFETPQRGQITLKDKVLFDSKSNTFIPPHFRKIGMVFQDYALFPHLNLRKNIAFGLKNMGKEAQKKRVDELLALINLTDYAQHYPHQISGGMQQRVALARALAPKPDLILLDEPFSGLDTALRQSLSKEVRALLKEEGISAILVTHDQHEAFAMCDKIGILHYGVLQQWDTPQNLYFTPQTPYVAGFIGEGTLLNGTIEHKGGHAHINFGIGHIPLHANQNLNEGDNVKILLRPECLTFAKDSPIQLTLCEKDFLGDHWCCKVKSQCGQTLFVHCEHEIDAQVGEHVGVKVRTHEPTFFT